MEAPDRTKRRACGGAELLASPMWCSTARWIVGTALYHEGGGAAPSAAQKVGAEKGERQLREPPVASVARRDAESPPMWKRGMQLRQTSAAPSCRLAASARPLRTRVD